MSPEPERDRAQQPRKGSSESRSARVKRELLAETNGSYTTSELSYFLLLFLLPRKLTHHLTALVEKLQYSLAI